MVAQQGSSPRNSWLRHAAVGLLAVACVSAAAQVTQMRADGPNAFRLGRLAGYPGCANALQRPECRVGAWSGQFGNESRGWVQPSSQPLALPDHPSPPAITWRSGGQNRSLDDFMDATQTTSLLILKDGQVVAERYQYDRKPGMPMRSFSMAKTVTALLVGIAQDRGLIRSLDDPASAYWPEIADTLYGQTTIRHLLRMSSGIPYRELYTWTADDDNWVWGQVLYSPANRGRPERILEYLRARTQREAPQGTRFHYASIETEMLGRVLLRASGKTIAQLTEEWLWKPMGAEHPAYWLRATTDGAEAAAGGFNASLRDFARLGLLLAQDGSRDGVQVIPRDYLLAATEVARQPEAFHPRRTPPALGYGYQVWLLPGRERTFVLQGIHGQHVFVQPASKIVMVQTSVNEMASGRQDATPYQLRNALWAGVLRSLGGSTD